MSPTETTTERLFLGEQMLHTLPLSSGVVRREFPIRRLRLVGGNNVSRTTEAQVADPGMGVSHDTVEEDTMFDEEGNSDTHTETIVGASVGDEEPNGKETTVGRCNPRFPKYGMVPDQNIAVGFESLDEVDLVFIFNRRANVMRAIPYVLKGPYVSAVRIAIREAFGSTSWWKRAEVDAGMEAFLVASPHVAFPSAKGRQDPETTIVGTFCTIPEGPVE